MIEPDEPPPSVLARIVSVQEDELRPLAWSAAMFFFLMMSWYILRPLREEVGASERDVLALLYTGTFFGTLVVIPLYTWVASGRLPRWFVPATYRFLAGSMLVFFALMLLAEGSARSWIDRVFYVWASVYNMTIVSIFWSTMADRFDRVQATRLFGAVAVGGTLGAVVGSALMSFLPERVGGIWMVLPSVLSVELACQCLRILHRSPDRRGEERCASCGRDRSGLDRASPCPGCGALAVPDHATPSGNGRVGGNVWTGLTTIARSPYLLWICGYLFLFTMTSTFMYFEQSSIVREAIADRDARTVLFARMNLAVNVIALLVQLFLTGRLIRWIGVRGGLLVLPIFTAVGFAALGAVQLTAARAQVPINTVLIVLVVFQVCRRATNFALAKPVREMLFTLVGREAKYKSKAFIDVVLYRGGDVVSSYVFEGLNRFLSLGAMSYVAVAVAGTWMLTGHRLGWLHGRPAPSDPARTDATATHLSPSSPARRE